MPKYTAPAVASLIFADLPSIAGKVDTINDRYTDAIDAAMETKGATVKVDAADLTLLLSVAMSAIMLKKEERSGESLEQEITRMMATLVDTIPELEEAQAEMAKADEETGKVEASDDRGMLPPELAELVSDLEKDGHTVTVRAVEVAD